MKGNGVVCLYRRYEVCIVCIVCIVCKITMYVGIYLCMQCCLLICDVFQSFMYIMVRGRLMTRFIGIWKGMVSGYLACMLE